MNRLVFTLVAVLAIAVGLLVGTLNSEKVLLDLLWVQLEWPLGLLILLSMAGGLLLGLILVYLSRVFPLSLKLRKLQATVARTEIPDVSNTDD